MLTIFLMPLGGYYIVRGSHRVRRDLSLVVEELMEEQAYHDLIEGGREIPVMQVNLSGEYGLVRLKELAEAKNKGEQMIYTVKKTLTDHGDKASDEEKSEIEAKISQSTKETWLAASTAGPSTGMFSSPSTLRR